MGKTLIEFITSTITDAKVRDQVLAELHWRGMDRDHGLIFEDSIEEIDTPTRHPRPGMRVQLRRDRKDKRRFEVIAANGADITVAPLREPEDRRGWEIDPDEGPCTFQDAELMTVVTHTEQVFPGLVHTGSAGSATDAPSHIAIRGENLHALRALNYTHAGGVDLIYIDPPYNTGTKDWIYNDKRIDSNDAYRHSKWLAFMQRRLELARDLLAETGVIIVAIDDHEQHRLRLLLDDVFGEDNFVGMFVWQGQGSSLSKAHQGGVDYMLVYARAKDSHFKAFGKWRDTKKGAEEANQAAAAYWDESHDISVTEKAMKKWMKEHKDELESGVLAYKFVDDDGYLYRGFPLDAAGGVRYDVIHPITGRPVPIPSRGWSPRPEKMKEYLEKGRILFGPDESTIPTLKTRLVDAMQQLPVPTFYASRGGATKHLESILGEKRFPNPKDHTILMRWLGMAGPRDALVLDFFGGSGSTLEAVMRLNEQDGGSRQCIIATSNELGDKVEAQMEKAGYAPGDPEWEAQGVYEYVLRPRIETIISGTRPDGSTYDKALDGEHRVEFFTLGYMDDEGGIDTLIDYDMMAPLLWARAGGRGDIPARPALGDPYVIGETFAILFDLDHVRPLAKQIAVKANITTIFIVAASSVSYRQAQSDLTGQLAQPIKTIHLEQTYLASRAWMPRDRRRSAR